MNNPTPGGDYSAWLDQHMLLWGEHEYPENALLHVSSKGDFTGRRVPLDDVDAAWDYAAAKSFTDIYIRVAPLNGDAEYAPGARGKKADSLALPAVWLDVDCAHGVHGSEALPTMKQAGRIVRGVLAPTLIIATGGGVHCYWALDELLDWTEHEATLRRWADLWKAKFAEKGFEVDSGVSRDVGRILRMAGTFNGKTDPPRPVETLECDPFRTYTVEDILAVAPVNKSAEAERAAAGAVRRVGGPVARRVNAALPVVTVMEKVWGLVHLEGDRWSLPYADGSHNPTGSAQVWKNDGGASSVTAFSDRLQKIWSQPDEAHSLRAWDLIHLAIGDQTLAQTFSKRLLDRPEELLAIASQYRSLSGQK